MVESLIKSIVEAMYERENAKKKMRIYHGSSNDLNILISATDYYIRANLWILQSLDAIQSKEICI